MNGLEPDDQPPTHPNCRQFPPEAIEALRRQYERLHTGRWARPREVVDLLDMPHADRAVLIEVVESMRYGYRFAWKNNPRRAELFGRRCRIVRSGRLGSVLLEFDNGEQVVSSRRALRKVKP